MSRAAHRMKLLHASRKIAAILGFASVLSLLSGAAASALDAEVVQPLPQLEGSFTLPKPPKPMCATLEKQCLKSCQTASAVRGPIYCDLGCAVARADCESGFTSLGQCNAPKGSGCL